MSENKFLYVVHVERAGGTTLHRLLQNLFPGYLSLRPWWCWANEPENAVGEKELAALHRWVPGLSGVGGRTTRSWNVNPRLVGPPVMRFAFLRDPIERYMSLFNYQRVRMGVDWTIQNCVAEEPFENYHTERYAGRFDLAEAKRVLSENFEFAGLTDRFDEPLLLWRQALGRPDLSVRYEGENALREEGVVRFDDLSAVQQRAVEDANALDQELVAHGREQVFSRQENEYPGNLNADVIRFRETNAGFCYPRLRARLRSPWGLAAKNLIEPVLHARHDRPKPLRGRTG